MSLDMSKRGHQKFQRIAKTVKTICGINLVLKGYIQKAKVTKWVTYHLTRQLNLDKELLFNIHNFTKNKTERDSAKLKCLFSVLPHQRSTEDTAMIQSLLRKTQAFQVMPYIMQLEICQAAVYQQYEAKTIVLRKGHHSEACYFVLTGELIATLSDSCSENRNHLTGVVNEIQEGDLFGDAALLTNTKRPATILCKTNTELLLLNKEDFESILAGFLQQRYSAITELLRSLPIFTPWNAEKLTLLSYSSLLRYYRSGTAVIPKSSRSSFIVVVKSGRCNVVTNLKMGQHRSDLSQCPQQKKISGGRKDLSLMEVEKKLAGRSPQRNSTSLGLILKHTKEVTKTQQIRKSRCTKMSTSSHSVLKEDSFEELEHKGLKEQLSHSASSPTLDTNIQQSVSHTPKSTKSSAVTHISESTICELEEMALDEASFTDRSPSSRSAETVLERMIASAEDNSEMQEDYNSTDSCEEIEQHKETNKESPLRVTRSSENTPSIFVKIGRMEQGGIFGLTEIPGSTCNLRLSLVSDGAECIFIPKRLFLDEAPVNSRHATMELANTYPSEQIVRQNFARQQEWNLYKTKLVKQLVSDSVKQRSGLVKLRKKIL